MKWKQPKYPLTKDWIKKMWNMKRLLLTHKKNEIMPFAATWMDLKVTILSEISQTEKDK